MRYETYRRVRISHPGLVIFTYTSLLVVVAVIFPILLSSGYQHLDVESPHAVRFVYSRPPQEVEEEETHRQLTFSSRHMLSASTREHKMKECQDLAAEYRSSRKQQRQQEHQSDGVTVKCVFKDYLEIIEADSEQFFVTTSINQTVESRKKVDTSRHVPDVWTRVDDASSLFFTVAPELTRVSVDHRLTNEGFDVESSVGFLLTHDECQRLGRGSSSANEVLSSFRSASEQELAEQHGRRLLRGGHDVFKVDELLSAANISSVEQLRLSGAHLDVRYSFSNLLGRFRAAAAAAQQQSFQRSSWLPSISDIFVLPSETVVYTVCVEAVRPLSAHFFFSSTDTQRARKKKLNHRKKSDKLQTQRDAEHDEEKEFSSAVAAEGKQGDGEVELRRVFYHRGVRARFRVSGHLGRTSASASLRFLASASSLLSLPYIAAEYLLSYIPAFGAEPKWFKEFVVDLDS